MKKKRQNQFEPIPFWDAYSLARKELQRWWANPRSRQNVWALLTRIGGNGKSVLAVLGFLSIWRNSFALRVPRNGGWYAAGEQELLSAGVGAVLRGAAGCAFVVGIVFLCAQISKYDLGTVYSRCWVAIRCVFFSCGGFSVFIVLLAKCFPNQFVGVLRHTWVGALVGSMLLVMMIGCVGWVLGFFVELVMENSRLWVRKIGMVTFGMILAGVFAIVPQGIVTVGYVSPFIVGLVVLIHYRVITFSVWNGIVVPRTTRRRNLQQAMLPFLAVTGVALFVASSVILNFAPHA